MQVLRNLRSWGVSNQDGYSVRFDTMIDLLHSPHSETRMALPFCLYDFEAHVCSNLRVRFSSYLQFGSHVLSGNWEFSRVAPQRPSSSRNATQHHSPNYKSFCVVGVSFHCITTSKREHPRSAVQRGSPHR